MMFRQHLLFVGALSLAACNSPSKTNPEVTKQTPRPSSNDAPAAVEAPPIQGTLTIDESKSSISFVGANVLSSHEGSFKKFSGTITVGANGPESIAIDVDATSIFVEHPKLLGHLRAEDFFFVEEFPSASFKSTKITPSTEGENTHDVTGEFTIRGVTKEHSFPILVAPVDGGWKGTATLVLERTQFGIAWKGAADNLVKTEVPLTLELVAKRSS